MVHGKALALSSDRLPVSTPFYYGWLMVGISALGIFFSGPGQTYSNSVFIESYIAAFGMSNTAVSGIYSAATLISGFMLFAIGKLTDLAGRRIMLTLVAFLLGLACIWNSFVTGAVTMFIGFLCVRLFGQGSMTLIPSTLVSQWFIKQRGRAHSLASLGGLIGASFFPPFINWMIVNYDWQIAWRTLGFMLIVLFVPIAFFFVRNKPEDVGLMPDHRAKDAASEAASTNEEMSWTLSEAARTSVFWFMLVCMAIPAMIYTGLTFQLFPILGEQGVDRTTTAMVLSVVPMVSFACSLISGWIADKVKVHIMLGLTFLMNTAAPVLLFASSGGNLVLAFAVAWGAAQGFMNIPLAIVWPNYFGRQHLGSIQSITSAAMVIGSAIGPVAFGMAFDEFGSYQFILLISMLIWIIGAFLAFMSPAPAKK